MDEVIPSWRLLAFLAPVTIVVAMALSAGLIMALMPWLRRYALARPNARSSHKVPTPQGGGIAVVSATLGCGIVAIAALGGFSAADRWRFISVLTATAVLAVIGAIDDLRAIHQVPRLLLQVGAVALVILALPSDLAVLPFLPHWIERSLLVLGGVWFVNSVNFMDGLDWMTVAETVPVTVGLAIVGWLGTLAPAEIALALALCGATLGFAPFNRPVAKLFLGDVGSLPIGLLLGWLLLLVAGHGHLTAALLLPLYYVADAGITLLRRLLNGEKIWEAHRSHFYQRATDRGFSVPQIIARVFVVNCGLVALAIASVVTGSQSADAGMLLLGLGLVGGLLVRFSRSKRIGTA